MGRRERKNQRVLKRRKRTKCSVASTATSLERRCSFARFVLRQSRNLITAMLVQAANLPEMATWSDHPVRFRRQGRDRVRNQETRKSEARTGPPRLRVTQQLSVKCYPWNVERRLFCLLRQRTLLRPKFSMSSAVLNS